MQIKTIQNANYLITDLVDGDLVPLGGSIFGGPANMFLSCDTSNMSHFYTLYTALCNKMNMSEHRDMMQSYLQAYHISCSVDMFQYATAFTRSLQKTYPDFSVNLNDRKANFIDHTPTLSQQFEMSRAACVEVSALAMTCLSHSGLTCAMMVGETIKHKDEEFPDDHTFLIVQDGNKHFIFDAANHLKYPDGSWAPNVYNVSEEQANLLLTPHAENSRCLVESKNIMSPVVHYFGYGDKTNVVSSEIVLFDTKTPDVRTLHLKQ